MRLACPKLMLGDLVRYVGFTADDSRRLTTLRPFALPALPAIAEQFYASILASESARVVLGDPRRAIALKTSLVRWIDTVLAGPHDESLVDLARTVGQTHVRVAAPPRYVIGSMSCIRAGLVRIAADSMPHDLAEVAGSISKVLDIECALMMDAYAEHWLALVQREERAELRRVQTKLEDVEWAFEQSAETANMLVIGLDASGQVVLFNAAAAAVTGIPPGDALGRDAFEMLFGEAAPAVRQVVLASRPVPPFLELTLRAREGELRTCRFFLSRHVPWGSDRPTHLLTAIDWEDERRAQRAERHRARLGAISNLGSGFAHEIRNPLNGAMLSSMVLQRALIKKDGAGDTLGLVRALDDELQRIKRLTDDFLAFVNPVALALANVAIGPLCTRVVDRARKHAPAGMAIATALPSEALVVEADEKRLEGAVEHLVTNAIEALVDARGTVTVRAAREPAHASIEVEDDGRGLPEPRDMLFDAYFTTKPKSVGLGLAIAQRTALDHGGSLEVKNVPGKTVFSLRIPLFSRPPA